MGGATGRPNPHESQLEPQVGARGFIADPRSPYGGTGRGSSTSPRPRQPDSWWSLGYWEHRAEDAIGSVIHTGEQFIHATADTLQRARDIFEAALLAQNYVPGAVINRIGVSVEELLHAFLPGLLMMLAILGTTTVLGATVGAIVGALAGGVGALPGAVVGGDLGLDAGLAVLDVMGIGFLLVHVVKDLPKVFILVKQGIDLAWNAGHNPAVPRTRDVDHAAHRLAQAVAELMVLLVEGLLAFLLKDAAVMRAGKIAGKTGELTDATAIAVRSREILEAMRRSPAEVRAAINLRIAELEKQLSRAGRWAEGLVQWVKNRLDQILESFVKQHQRELPANPAGTGEEGAAVAGASGGRQRRSGSVLDQQQSSPASSRGADDPASPKGSSARSWQYQPKQTGRVDPGSVPENQSLLDQIAAASNRTAPDAPSGWPQMSDSAAKTFNSTPEPTTLTPGTPLYRVIDQDSSAGGSYWSLDPPPSTEADWRGGSAVKDEWNGDGGYVESTVPDQPPSGVNVWSGPAAPQPSAVPGYVLPGGHQQIWVPRNTLSPDVPPQPTPWNPTK